MSHPFPEGRLNEITISLLKYIRLVNMKMRRPFKYTIQNTTSAGDDLFAFWTQERLLGQGQVAFTTANATKLLENLRQIYAAKLSFNNGSIWHRDIREILNNNPTVIFSEVITDIEITELAKILIEHIIDKGNRDGEYSIVKRTVPVVLRNHVYCPGRFSHNLTKQILKVAQDMQAGIKIVKTQGQDDRLAISQNIKQPATTNHQTFGDGDGTVDFELVFKVGLLYVRVTEIASDVLAAKVGSEYDGRVEVEVVYVKQGGH